MREIDTGRSEQACGPHHNRRLRIAAAHLAAVGTEHQHPPPFVHRGNRHVFAASWTP